MKKSKYKLIINIFLLHIVPTIAISQESEFLSYENITSGDQKYIDWNTVVGDTTFRMWCDKQKPIFYSLDSNNDDVLNKRDLSTYTKEDIELWTDGFISETLNFWSPSHKKHFSALKVKYDDIIKTSENLKNTSNAIRSIQKTLTKIGVSNTYDGRFFIEAERNYKEPISIIEEGFTNHGSKWIAVKANVNFKIHGSDKSTETAIDLIFITLRKLPTFNNNDRYALVELGVK